MIYAGHRPGAGSYECEACAEIMILTENSEELPPCPYCNNITYLTVSRDVNGSQADSGYQYDLYKDESPDETVKRFFSGYF
jgi:hypothetical protein